MPDESGAPICDELRWTLRPRNNFRFWTRTRHDVVAHFGSLDIRYLRSIIFLLVHYNPIGSRNSVSNLIFGSPLVLVT